MERAHVIGWLDRYGRAWATGDSSLLVGLFREDASYRSNVFMPPHLGHEGIRSYWEQATPTQKDVSVELGAPLIDREWVVAEWWTTTMRDTGEEAEITLPGVLLLRFSEGSCAELWEYWNLADGIKEPFEDWGQWDRSASSDGTTQAARRWSQGWADAWRRRDAEAVSLLYSEDARFRSHPFREPLQGREGILAYARQAFGDEDRADPRFGAPLTEGANAVVEYWTTMVEAGQEVTLAGCSLLCLDARGLTRSQRDYWHMTRGISPPPQGWGTR
ncbi:hypothetical protein BH24ACT26_BH24ACT26_08730 [soil metagenome]